MANSVFEGINISTVRAITLRYKVDGYWEAIPILTINNFRKEYILDKEFKAKGWFYERCMSCIPYPKEKWPEIDARLVFTNINHINIGG